MVGDPRYAVEFRRTGDVAFQLQDAGDPVQIAVRRFAQPVQRLQRADLHLAAGFFLADFRADLAGVPDRAVFLAQRTGEIDGVAVALVGVVVVGRPFPGREGEADRGEAGFGLAGRSHRDLFLS